MNQDVPGILIGEDGRPRCFWSGKTPLYQRYHDDEWGRPVTSDSRLFEKLCLEGFQSGLSWITILRKRENFRAAFQDFDIDAVAAFTEADVEGLMQNKGIVRNRRKIESTLNNAKRAQELRAEFGDLAAYFWGWVPPQSERPEVVNQAAVKSMGKTPTSIALAKDLKHRGFSFVGPTTAYAFLQAEGMVNDHLEGCFARPLTEEARQLVLAGR